MKRRAFPKAYAAGGPAFVILAPGTRLGLQRVDRRFQFAQAIPVGIVPLGIEDHRRRKKLRTAEQALSALHGMLVRAQAPAGIKGLAEHARLVACKNRLKPHL